MTLLEWREEYRIGVAEVDHEHQQLIALINELHRAIAGGASDAAVSDFLGELHAQIAAHFALEEKVMHARHYSAYPEHKQDHEQLLEQIRDIMDDFEREHRYDSSSLGAVLSAWFGGHFRTHDARLHAALGGS